MTDLITRAKEYLSKTEGITEGAWCSLVNCCYSDGVDGTRLRLEKKEPPFFENKMSIHLEEKDHEAMMLTPTARKLIEELVSELKDYEDRINELTNAVDYFTGDSRQGIYTAIGIMTEDKEGDSD